MSASTTTVRHEMGLVPHEGLGDCRERYLPGGREHPLHKIVNTPLKLSAGVHARRFGTPA
jgi:hypothetical protein